MADQTNLVVNGDEEANDLKAYVVPVGDEFTTDFFKVYNVVHGNGGNDTLSGRGSEVIDQYGVKLYGGAGEDTLRDSEGTDTLSGGADNDYIYHWKGKDKISGGSGFDTLSVFADTGSYTIMNDLTITGIEKFVVGWRVKVGDFDLSRFEVIEGSGTFYLTERADIEGVSFVGGTFGFEASSQADNFDFNGSNASFRVRAGKGDDTVVAGLKKAELYGEDGNDQLVGSASGDYLSGGKGNDTIYGKDGNDHIYTGGGADTAYGGDGNDRFDIAGSSKSAVKTFYGGDGNDYFEKFRFMGETHSLISGGDGRDTLELSGVVTTFTVKDVEKLKILGSMTADPDFFDDFDAVDANGAIYLASGGKFIWHAKESKDSYISLRCSDEKDIIDLSSASRIFYVSAGGGDDRITGGKAGEYIVGGLGNDRLNGGKGDDGLKGSSGSDIFVFEYHTGEDRVEDFQNQGANKDRIDVSSISTITSYEDLIDHHAKIIQGELHIVDGKGGSLILNGMEISDLRESMFIF